MIDRVARDYDLYAVGEETDDFPANPRLVSIKCYGCNNEVVYSCMEAYSGRLKCRDCERNLILKKDA